MNGLVLLHGFTGSPASFDDLVRRIGARWPRVRVLRPALLGHASAAPASLEHRFVGGDAHEKVVRFEQEVDRLADGIARAGLRGSHLCGYSLGARVALGLLVRHGAAFSGATLIGVHPGLTSVAERAARVGSDERWCELLARRGVDAFLEAWRAQPLFATQRALPEAVAAQQRRVRSSQRADGLMRSLRVLGLGQMPDYRGSWRNVTGRLQLVVGEQDTKFVALARELAARAPSAELDVVAGAGHNVLLEAPEQVERILMRAAA